MKYVAFLAAIMLLSAPSVENKRISRSANIGDLDVDSMYSFTEKDDVAREIAAAKQQIAQNE